jgi:hypothetical protein
MRTPTHPLIARAGLMAVFGFGVVACGTTDEASEPSPGLKAAIRAVSADVAGTCADSCLEPALDTYGACIEAGGDEPGCIEAARTIFADCSSVCDAPAAEEPAAEEPAAEEPAAEEPAVQDPTTEAPTNPYYYGYLCTGELVLFGTFDSREDAALTCQSTDEYNPQLGGLRCSIDGEVVYDTCSGRADGSTDGSTDGATDGSTDGSTDGATDGSTDGSTADACYLNCRDFANRVAEACLGYGYEDELCLASGQAQLDSCVSGCGDQPVAEVPAENLYRGFFCNNAPFIETAGISREEALANCELNAAYAPGGVFCTYGTEVIFANCPVGVGLTGPAEPVPGPAECEGWEPAVLDRVPDAIDTTYWNADAMDCTGDSFKRFDARYGLWVGLTSCGDGGYRFFLSESAEGPFLPATDSSGHGQDFCELVNPEFTIVNGDDIQSGGCTDCSIGFNYSFVRGEVFVRSAFGERFVRTEAIDWGPYQSSVIRCGAGPLECRASGQLD